ncbi:helix-turn-helix domain-containing protein [Siphonobacter curvatus]|uniref:AraC family transcriptional regulator n=1 Tax=Siphonobacter curvatus TaxID=2094562 RepID=A0A2S7IJL7_9BACT|nr:AraC family transcriptional regulator [Siphonobacter curvatus]PQA56838.1 AraC family transcriptional regulator [Siphonobacter curvatus]
MSPDSTVPKILPLLAQRLSTVIQNRIVVIPETFGSGTCSGYVFNEHIRLLILNYDLREDLIVKSPEVMPPGKMILFKFQNVIPETQGANRPSVLIATSHMQTDGVVPIHSHRSTLNIEIDAQYLKSLLDTSHLPPLLQSLIENTQPLLFEEMIFPSLQTLVDAIVSEPVEETFKLFFLRVKVEELICRLLMVLKKRDQTPLYALNPHDLEIIYTIRDQMLARLETPPVIEELARQAHMSSSKFKRLFRQIFGDSLFSYYQTFRIKEAARLLKEEKLSVAEVGYRLGFTNLSHFSKVFHEHIGTKPKQYSRS